MLGNMTNILQQACSYSVSLFILLMPITDNISRATEIVISSGMNVKKKEYSFLSVHHLDLSAVCTLEIVPTKWQLP
jgi:hypothetical protein